MLWNKARRVIQRRSRAYHGLAFYHRQVEPGLRSECTATNINILSTQRSGFPEGHVPHGAPSDALEQSEAGSQQVIPTAW